SLFRLQLARHRLGRRPLAWANVRESVEASVARSSEVRYLRDSPANHDWRVMPDAKDVILKHIAAVNDRDSDAEPWAADAELVAPGGQASGRDDVISFLGVFHEAFPDLRLEIKQLL